jgi:hypothetical protein
VVSHSGRDQTSVGPWKGIVAAPVTHEAARVIVKWLDSIGAYAIDEDLNYA